MNTVQCNECGDKYQLESDYFEVKPTATNKISCFSRVSQVAGIASKNMSWVFSEMHMLFACVGLVFFSVKNFLFLRDLQGAEIIKLTDEVVSANLEREIEMVKHGKGLPQGVVKQRKTAYTPEQVNSMRSDQLKGVLEAVGFPTLSKKEERLECSCFCLKMRRKGCDFSPKSMEMWTCGDWVRGVRAAGHLGPTTTMLKVHMDKRH